MSCEHTWVYVGSKRQQAWKCDKCDTHTFTEPRKPWVGLTDEEVVDLKTRGRDLEFVSMTALRRFARDISQTLKEKNT